MLDAPLPFFLEKRKRLMVPSPMQLEALLRAPGRQISRPIRAAIRLAERLDRGTGVRRAPCAVPRSRQK